MAYGQTGSGKTYTIFGIKESMDYQDDTHPDMGIVPRAIKHIFKYIEHNAGRIKFKVCVSFMQVYMEHITDLIPDTEENMIQTSPMIFSKRNSNRVKNSLNIREDEKTGLYVENLKKIV
jgi:hypothetical protein